MIQIIRTTSKTQDFLALVDLLDKDLAVRDGDDHEFYHQINSKAELSYIVMAYENEIIVGCGALKIYDETTLEVKRMYVVEQKRGLGIASKILSELENWAISLNIEKCLLETGFNQPEAIALYTKQNYEIIPNYGSYEGVSTSICFQKKFIK